jgi:hypothetical protein
MTTSTKTPVTAEYKGVGLWAATLLIAQFIAIWATFFILSSAIGWPASLDDPASIALPRLLDNQTAVLLGYGLYLLAALLLVPATAALTVRLKLGPALSAFLLGTSVVSALAKTIGISRWLFVMPDLARAYVAPGADQSGIALIFDALNAYAGGIGEIVGVGLVTGIWTVAVGLILARRGASLIGGFAAIGGAGLFLTLPAGFGVELGPVLTITNIVWQFALLAVGIWSLRGRPIAA